MTRFSTTLATGSQIRAIALATCRETLRDRLLLGVMGFLLLALGTLVLLEGSRPAAALDVGLSLMTGVGVLVSLFLGTNMIHKELDKRTLYIVLAKPITRFRFLAGKFLGVMASQTLLTGLMALGLAALMLASGNTDWRLFALLPGVWMTMATVTALALAFATVTAGPLAAMYAGGLFLVGQQTLLLREFANSEITLSKVNYLLGHVLYYVLPNFGAFDHKNTLLYGGTLSWSAWAWGLAYGALLCAGLLAMATAAWEARELP